MAYLPRVLILLFSLSFTSLVLGEIDCPQPCVCREDVIKHKRKHVIDCSNQGLEEVPSFVGLAGRSFDYLLLSNNNIRSLQSRAFRGLTVKHLDISGNQISGISDNAFKGLSGLQELVAENAGFSSAPFALSHLSHLKILRLRGNRINQLNARVFASLSHLHTLDVSDNRLDFAYPFTGFQTLKDLRILKLGGCEIDNMPVDALEDVSAKLKILVLRDNNIRNIPDGILQKMINLEELDLENNPIRLTPEKLDFKGLAHLKILKLGRCDLSGSTLNSSLIQDNSKLRTFTIHTCNINKVEPGFFHKLKHLNHLNIGGNNISLSKELFSGVAGRLHSVDLSNMSISEMPRFLFEIFGKAKNISLAHNKMKNLPAGSFSNLPQGGTSIDLNNNGVTSVNVHFLKDAKRPIRVDLSNNSISRLEFLTGSPCNFEGADLDLRDNPISCDPTCGVLLTMQKKLFDVTGTCSGPRGVIGYNLMWKPGKDATHAYLERNSSALCGAEDRLDQRYLCCEKKWVNYSSKITCGTNKMTSFYLHLLIVVIISFILS